MCSCNILEWIHPVDPDVHFVLAYELEQLTGILLELPPRYNIIKKCRPQESNVFRG